MLATNQVSTIVRGVLQKSQTAAQRNVQVKLIAALFFLMALVKCSQGEWQEWGDWSECDPSCSCATKIRARACSSTNSSSGENTCLGESTETAPCAPGCCGNDALRIRTSEPPYNPSCPTAISPGRWILVNLGFDDQTQETQTPRRSTSLTTCSPS